MKSFGWLSCWVALAGLVFGAAITAHAVEPTPPRSTLTQPRTGTTNKFGSGTITTERGRDGKTTTGHTQKFGSGTVTNRSDGSTSRSQPFGSGTLRTDQLGRKSR
jgi:hypothetical protein